MRVYKPTIGMEIHAELKTEGKMFSNAPNCFSAKPNINVNLIDIALPGTLPQLNHEAIELALKAALALNCKINKKMHFDRKNYFYLDLPKGYQITQHNTPIGYDGYIEIEIGGKRKKIAIECVHIEEDTCKSIHEDDKTYLDYNRAGIPLIEIVTKPVIESAEEVKLYLTKVREILRYLDVSDVKMEEGSMRCEANVSISDTNKLGTKVEIKNVGSISYVVSAIEYETKRQKEILSSGGQIKSQTRRYVENKKKTELLREKEGKNDYRYFPESDLPLVEISEEDIMRIKEAMPILPDQLYNKYQQAGINEPTIKAILSSRELAAFFEEIYDQKTAPIAAKYLVSGVLKYLNKHGLTLKETKLTAKDFNELIKQAELNDQQIQAILENLLLGKGSLKENLKQIKEGSISNEDEILTIINEVMAENKKEVASYRDGNERVLKYLMGQIMKKSKGKIDPQKAHQLLLSQLS